MDYDKKPDSEVMCYVAKKTCGCIVAATVDIPDIQRDNANEIAKWVRRGYTVDRMTVEQARPLLTFDCKHDQPEKPARKR